MPPTTHKYDPHPICIHRAAKGLHRSPPQAQNFGAGLFDLYIHDQALKLSWIDSAIHKTNAFWTAQLQSCLCKPLQVTLTTKIKSINLKWVCCQTLLAIWKCILTYWCDLHYVISGTYVALLLFMYNSVLVFKSHNYVFRDNYIAG